HEKTFIEQLAEHESAFCRRARGKKTVTHTVYSNLSKGILAKSKDLIKSFGSDDHTKICLDKGELQVAGKERESQFSSQFRDISTIVMQKTLNPETQRRYTISMVERLMHEIHFAVDPHSNSKKQPSPMRLRLTVPVQNFTSLLDKAKRMGDIWIVCEMEPGLFRECDSLVRNMQGRLEILAVSVHAEGDTSMNHYDDYDDMALQTNKPLNLARKWRSKRWGTCNTFVGEAKQYREHCKSDWHKHNLKRKTTRKLPPLTAHG
ncbi:hypothetical protein HID58_069312, partial [Brassica napus]